MKWVVITSNFVRVTAAVPEVIVANPEANAERIINIISKSQSDVVVFPELCVTGCTCDDLFLQESLIKSSYKALGEICLKTEGLSIIGMPVVIMNRLYNCGVVINAHRVVGIVPQTCCMDYSGAVARRYFSSSEELSVSEISSGDLGFKDEYIIPLGNSLIFDGKSFKFAIEVGADLFAPVTNSTLNALKGAEIIFSLGAMPSIVSAKETLYKTVETRSRLEASGYVYASAGVGESTTEYVFKGDCFVTECGKIIAENKKSKESVISADIDIDKIRANRLKSFLFKSSSSLVDYDARLVCLKEIKLSGDGALHPVSKSPFIPDDERERVARAEEIFDLQVRGLKKRMDATGGKLVVGVSGGLDSTLALLVCARAAEMSGRSPKDVIGITMPCFGTTGRTFNNSVKLMESLGITIKEINIKNACEIHFKDIGHSGEPDLTYENTQARERTQVLMDYAGMCGGFVVGTGDLSELVLGWCTYNGDHMSMYGVNSSVPKTLIKCIIETLVKTNVFPKSNEVLKDILNTPISPELLPPGDSDKIAQVTEDIVGPYILHDFFLYYVLRFGFGPQKVFELAKQAFRDEFDKNTIILWLKNFYRRFFTQQFKRSCLPDGVKIGSVGVSPKGELKMPSDAAFNVWLKEIEEIR